jgi:hypothetical protein
VSVHQTECVNTTRQHTMLVFLCCCSSERGVTSFLVCVPQLPLVTAMRCV